MAGKMAGKGGTAGRWMQGKSCASPSMAAKGSSSHLAQAGLPDCGCRQARGQMRSSCGQASTEVIAVFGFSLFIVLAFLAIALTGISDAARMQTGNEAYQSAHDLASAADEVYAQGEGASKTVTVRLPQGVVFNSNLTYIGKPQNLSSNGSIESRLVMINYGAGEASALAHEPIYGSFPTAAGIYRMKVISQGSHVSINPSLVELSRNSVYASMAQNESRQFTINFYKTSPESVDVNITQLWAFGEITFLVSPSSFAAQDGGSAVTLTISSSSAASGLYSSSLLVNATSPSGSEAILLPVGAEVQSG